MKIKVCGMREPENIIALSKLEPDYMGLIFYRPSKRFINYLNPHYCRALPSSIKLTGVFVDEEIDEILKLVQLYNLNAIQLHGSESVDFCVQLRLELEKIIPTHKIEFIKAFGIAETFDFNILKPYNSCVDYFLFDTKSSGYGGSGNVFEWEILRDYKEDKPFFLSGGISPENINNLLKLEFKNLFAVDLNSKFEIEPGLKNIESLQLAFDKIRN